MRNNDTHFDYGSIVGVLLQLVYQIERSDNSFSDYEDMYGNNNNNIYGFTIIFFNLVYGAMNQIHASCNKLYYGEQCLLFIIIIQVRNDACQMETNDDNKEWNNDTCYDFYLYGNCPDNVDTWWYYFVNSNNGEIPENELNYQTSKISSTKTTSTMMWKILVRQLGLDMNDEYHKETINVWKAKAIVQVVMPNDHSKQDHHNQKKELKRCDHTDTNKEDQVYYDSNSNNDTFHDATQIEDVIEDTYDDNGDVNRKLINNVIDDTNDDNNNNQKPINNGFLQPVGE